MLCTYDDFIAKVNETGFLPFHGNFLGDFPSLQTLTLGTRWHTGEEETDPWKWKNRAANERILAFGCLLGGQKGFIARWLYPFFVSACRPAVSLEEQFEIGERSHTEWRVFQLFENNPVLSTADIRKAMGVTKSAGASQVDGAMKRLQRDFILTVCGSKRKVNREGFEYGWAANAYCPVETWAPAEWLSGVDEIDPGLARCKILDAASAMHPGTDRAALTKILFNN